MNKQCFSATPKSCGHFAQVWMHQVSMDGALGGMRDYQHSSTKTFFLQNYLQSMYHLKTAQLLLTDSKTQMAL